MKKQNTDIESLQTTLLNEISYNLELFEKNTGMLLFVITDADLSLNRYCLWSRDYWIHVLINTNNSDLFIKKEYNVILTRYTYTPWWTRFKWAWLCALKVAHSFHLVTFFTSISDDGVQAIFIIVFASNTTLQSNVFMVSYIRGFATDS